MRDLEILPAESAPKPRRRFLEWLYDVLVPPSPWEAEGRYLRMQLAERARVRTALQDRRTRAMEARKLRRDIEERERLDGVVQHGVFNVISTNSGLEYVLVVVLEQLANRGDVRELTVRSVYRSDKCHMPRQPSEEQIRSWVQADQKYIKFARPWKDGLLSTEALRKLSPEGFVFPVVSYPESGPTTDALLSAECERLNNMAITLADQLRVYEGSRSILDYIAEWERVNGTLACIMSEEVPPFIKGLQRAAAKSSTRTTIGILEKQNTDRRHHIKQGEKEQGDFLDLNFVAGPTQRILREPETSAASAVLKRIRDRMKEEDDYAKKV